NFVSSDVPKLIHLPFLNPVNEGRLFKIYCTVSQGSAPIHFRWLKNGSPVDFNGDILKEDSELESSLRIKSLKHNDSGNYTCIARNNFGEDSQTTSLLVKCNYHEIIPPLKWIVEPTDVVSKVGDVLKLQCKANGSPFPHILWKKQDTELKTEDGTLTLNSLTTKDAGNYECIAENGGDLTLK
ncbi:Down syndrome cell adhesion molecule-like protein Dscam2, partial [Leptotrombidium deliense]